MNAFTRNQEPVYVDDLIAKISLYSSTVIPSTAQCYGGWQQAHKPQGWFMRISEASYDAWRKNGSHSYGL